MHRTIILLKSPAGFRVCQSKGFVIYDLTMSGHKRHGSGDLFLFNGLNFNQITLLVKSNHHLFLFSFLKEGLNDRGFDILWILQAPQTFFYAFDDQAKNGFFDRFQNAHRRWFIGGKTGFRLK